VFATLGDDALSRMTEIVAIIYHTDNNRGNNRDNCYIIWLSPVILLGKLG